MGTTDERLERIMTEFGDAVMAYSETMGGPAVEDDAEVARLEKAVMDTGAAVMPVLFSYLYSATYGQTELDDTVRELVDTVGYLGRGFTLLRRVGESHEARIAELEKRMEYLESSTVRNYAGADGVDGVPAALKIPDWDTSIYADQQVRVALTLLLGELHNRFRAPTT